MADQTERLDTFFDSLQRPDSPNNWLVAPVDFLIKPDAVAPVFPVPAPALLETFKSVVLRPKRITLVAQSARALHLVAATCLLRFEDDVWALFMPVAESEATLALYSASRVGYWDMGTNRRRLNAWIERLRYTLGA
ncbi:MAG TPA: DUF1499 domain-containing protein [Burkholderiales bacterium]|nr:DUF1499 domain-containing protein [Burkholderiales bacterium]